MVHAVQTAVPHALVALTAFALAPCELCNTEGKLDSVMRLNASLTLLRNSVAVPLLGSRGSAKGMWELPCNVPATVPFVELFRQWHDALEAPCEYGIATTTVPGGLYSYGLEAPCEYGIATTTMPGAQSTVELVESMRGFGLFAELLAASGVEAELDGATWHTLLVPSDAAFAAIQPIETMVPALNCTASWATLPKCRPAT